MKKALAVLMAAACGDDSRSAGSSDAGGGAAEAAVDVDAPADAAPVKDAPSTTDGGPSARACDPAAPFGAPQPVPGVKTAAYEGSATLSHDEREIYFEVYAGSASQLYVARRATTGEPFGAPAVLSLDAGGASNYGAMLSLDDVTFVFASDRGGASSLYRATRASRQADFGAPSVVAGLGVAAESGYLTSQNAGLWLTARQPNGKLDLYFAATGGAARDVTELNTDATETGPVPTADGDVVFFGSSRDDPAGTRLDVWMATRASATSAFGAPTRVTELNTADDDWPSWLSPDGCRLYLSSNRNGNYDVYVATRGR